MTGHRSDGAVWKVSVLLFIDGELQRRCGFCTITAGRILIKVSELLFDLIEGKFAH
jgi:hypothetical protein